MTLSPAPARRVLLIVIDGLGAASLRRALADGHAPHIAALIDAGATFGEATSPFPSLTPVCLATIATGAGPDRHRIPSLGWYSRGRGRFVEYGSSFSATIVEGTRASIEDVIVNLNHVHLAEEPRTIFERVQDAGLEAAAVNQLVWRGRTRHTMRHDYGPVRAAGKHTRVHAVYGPDHFYFGELFGGMRPLLPQVGIKRPTDWGGGRIARWLLRSTGSSFVLLYLGQHDAASHKLGPDAAQDAIRAADRALGRVVDAAGDLAAFLEGCAVIVCADHGQTSVDHHASLEDVFDDVTLYRGGRGSRRGGGRAADECDLAVVGSNRVAMAYRTRQPHHGDAPAGPNDRWIAQRALESPATAIAAYHDAAAGQLVVLAPGGGELRATRNPEALRTERSVELGGAGDRWAIEGDPEVLDLEVDRPAGVLRYGDYPDGFARLASALACVNTGDVMVSAEPGWEFTDIGGRAHTGGSHGSLHRVDSLAPLIAAGLAPGVAPPVAHARLADIVPVVAAHLGLAAE